MNIKGEPEPWNAGPGERELDQLIEIPPQREGRCPRCDSPAYLAAARAAGFGQLFCCPDCEGVFISTMTRAAAELEALRDLSDDGAQSGE